MFQQLLNWRTVLALIAILIVSGTVFYSKYLAHKIAGEERQKVEEWVEAGKTLLTSTSTGGDNLAIMILTQNTAIPIIETDERDSITNYINLDSAKANADPGYLRKRLKGFKSQNDPITWVNPLDSTQRNNYYYGESLLLKEVRYYPLIQLFIVALFIIITLLALRGSYRSTQNQVWAGMAKETAHQLGTPVSSLEGWLEILKENPGNDPVTAELEKDVRRLRLISDRFGKIGSTPHLAPEDIVYQIQQMADYIRKRASGKVQITVTAPDHPVLAPISGPLFDWVIENLMKNALDAMDGKGKLSLLIQDLGDTAQIDVTDTGKGISAANIARVFDPGFTTKKRGWGLGLSLSRRIIVQYHKGTIAVRHSEIGKGTTFRIVLKK